MISISLPKARADGLFQDLLQVTLRMQEEGRDDFLVREEFIHEWSLAIWSQCDHSYLTPVKWRGDVQRVEFHPRLLPPDYLDVLKEHIQELDWLLD